MVTTKSGVNTILQKDNANNSNQAFKSTLTLPTRRILHTMKFDSALQHIFDTVLELWPKYCIWLCFDKHDICTLREILSLERNGILVLQYRAQSGALLFIKKHGVGLILSVQCLLNFLSYNVAAVNKD